MGPFGPGFRFLLPPCFVSGFLFAFFYGVSPTFLLDKKTVSCSYRTLSLPSFSVKKMLTYLNVQDN